MLVIVIRIRKKTIKIGKAKPSDKQKINRTPEQTRTHKKTAIIETIRRRDRSKY